MRTGAPSRKSIGIAALTLMVSALGMTAGVFVAGPAAASGTASTTTGQTGTTDALPGASYFVLNGTVHAASDHEVLGSSAFPNYATGAVDNYYSMADTHVDNSPFAEGTASPADTGPVGQTAAAGNTQQPQYADARWPGDSGKAAYGSQGGPYATAAAGEYRATAAASEASSGLSGPSMPGGLATPKGFDGRLRQALAAWKAKWAGRLHLKTPAGPVETPAPPTVPAPAVTVTTPVATVATPTLPVSGLPAAPPVSVPAPAIPPAVAPQNAAPARSTLSASSVPPADGLSLLESSSLATLDPKTDALVTSGESRVGRVSIGGGQITIEGVHVTASITNDGTPSHKVAVSVGAASIGGVPVTIDQDGVHVSGQGQNLPFQQASDSLNGALKQAGIQLFLVSPEIKTGGSCDQGSGTQTGTTTTTTTTTSSTTTSSSDPAGGNGTGGSCDQTGTPASSSCGPASTTSTSTGTTTTSAVPLPGSTTGTTTTSSGSQPGTTTTTTGSCDQTDLPLDTSTCGQAGTTPTTTAATTTTTATTTTDPTGTTASPDAGDPTGSGTSPGEETVTATGLHVLFTQPVSQSGVPAQFAEHILGEVFLDSLAVAAGALPDLSLNLDLNQSSTSPSSCAGKGKHTGLKKKTTTGSSSTSAGGSTAGGPGTPGSPSGSTAGSTPGLQPASGVAGVGTQPVSSTAGSAPQSFPARLAAALRKPLWLLLAYLVWQALVIGTGASLWSWRKEEVS